MQAENDNRPAGQIGQLGLIGQQQRVNRCRARAQSDKDSREAADKCHGAGQNALRRLAFFFQRAQFGKLQTGGET